MQCHSAGGEGSVSHSRNDKEAKNRNNDDDQDEIYEQRIL